MFTDVSTFRFLLLLNVVAHIHCIRVVSTSYGFLRGVTFHSRDRQENYVFKSVPFAKPPVGGLRFRLPELPDSWPGIRDASNYSAACLSGSERSSYIPKVASEDCLYLNVFTSQRCLVVPCPVIVYLHGGAFNADSAVMFPDQFIIDRYSSQGVVFVIPAMRLGAFGLLAFGDEVETHQNIAAFDALAALKYVKSEISNFGGDPERITIMGHSSGGTLTIALASSANIDPERRLFQKAIALSPPTMFNDPNRVYANCRELATNLNCWPPKSNSTNFKEVVECLQNIDATVLKAAQVEIEKQDRSISGLLLGPPFTKHGESFKQLRKGAPPRSVMIGTTKSEMGKKLGRVDPSTSGRFMEFDNYEDVAEKFRKEHSENEYNDESQAVFVGSLLYSQAFTLNGGKVFLYETRQRPKSDHVSDMIYFIGIHRGARANPDSEFLDSFYSKMLVNFTKFGVPSPNWQEFDPKRRNYLALEVNTKEGIYPTNLEDFHRKEADYWLVRMTAFDRNVTLSRVQRVTQSALQTKRPITSQWWFYLAVVVALLAFFALFYFIYRECCLDKNGENTPLLN